MFHLLREIFSKIDRKTLLLGGTETLLIIFLSAKLYFNNPSLETKTIDNSKLYQDSIGILMKKYDTLQSKIISLNHSYDSLQNTKTQIEVQYRTQIKYINTDNLFQLDSLLRAEW